MTIIIVVEPHPLLRLGILQLLSDVAPACKLEGADYSDLSHVSNADRVCDIVLLSVSSFDDIHRLTMAAERVTDELGITDSVGIGVAIVVTDAERVLSAKSTSGDVQITNLRAETGLEAQLHLHVAVAEHRVGGGGPALGLPARLEPAQLLLAVGEVGLLLLCLSLGTVVALPASGAVVTRLGPARTVGTGAAVVCLGLLGMAAGLAVACLLVACACLLKPSARSIDRASRATAAGTAGDADAPPGTRRRWGPR